MPRSTILQSEYGDFHTYIHTHKHIYTHTKTIHTYTHTYIPEDISTRNIEGTPTAQNPDLNLKPGDINAKFSYESKKHTRNLVTEVSAQS
jgi:hypothetical protein